MALLPKNVTSPPIDANPVPPFDVPSVPVTPELNGSPVQFVSVPLVGVPNSGVTRVGLVANTKAPLPVSPVTAEAKFALDGVPSHVATPAPSPDIPVLTGSPVAFVNVTALGVPKFGVVSVGLVANTTVLPDPVVVAAVNAPPDPANTGADMVVLIAISASPVGSVTTALNPFPLVTVTLVTVPAPAAK